MLKFILNILVVCIYIIESVPLLAKRASRRSRAASATYNQVQSQIEVTSESDPRELDRSFFHENYARAMNPERLSRSIAAAATLIDSLGTVPSPAVMSPSVLAERRNELRFTPKAESIIAAPAVMTLIYGSIHETAYYFSDIYVGSSDAQRQSLILDTGSSVMGFPCTECRRCGVHLDDRFDCEQSLTCDIIECSSSCRYCDLQRSRCAYKVAYMEGSSLQGFWHEDDIRIHKITPNVFQINVNNELIYEGLNIPDSSLPFSSPMEAAFGCHVEETHLFVKQKASGIFGLETVSSSGPESFMKKTLIDGHFKTPEFSMCFSRTGGVMTVGGQNEEFHSKSRRGYDIIWTPIETDSGSYTVLVNEISVGGRSIFPGNVKMIMNADKQNSLVALVDSGTTLTYFPPSVYSALMKEITRVLNSGSRNLRYLRVHTGDGNATSASRDEKLHGRRIDVSATPRRFDFDRQMVEIQGWIGAKKRNTRAVKMNSASDEDCWFFSNERDLDAFPNILVSFLGGNGTQGGTLIWKPEAYLYEKGSQKYRCLGFAPDSNSGSSLMPPMTVQESIEALLNPHVVLGSSFFIQHDVTFHVKPFAEKIGFAQANCPQVPMQLRDDSFDP